MNFIPELPKGVGHFLAAVRDEVTVTGGRLGDAEKLSVNRDLGIVLGVCGHWWQALTVPEVMAMDCPRCGRPPGVFIGYWDETWPEPETAWNEE